MGFSKYSTITDELLSAYVDDAVTATERLAVEDAAANDSEVAWRLETLRNTVSLLGQLTEVPLPRSFALVEIVQVDDGPSAFTYPQPIDSSDSFWEKLLDFWRSGNMMWRNAAAVCALLLMVFLLGDITLTKDMATLSSEMSTMSQDVPSDMPAESAVMADEIVEAPAMVAMAPAPPTGDQEAITDGAASERGQSISSVGIELEGDEPEGDDPALLLDESAGATAGEVEAIEAVDDTEVEVAVVAAAMIAESPQATEFPVSPAGRSAAVGADSVAMTESVADMAVGTEAQVDVSDPELLIAASGLGEVEASAAEGETDPPAEPVVAESETVESVADVASAVEAEAPAQPMMLADNGAVIEDTAEMDTEGTQSADTGVQDSKSAESGIPLAAPAQEELVSEPVTEELVVQEAPPVAVARVDGAKGAEVDEAKQLSSGNMTRLNSAEVSSTGLTSTSAGESGTSPTRLFGLAQLFLAILALIFFVLWLHSRSRSATVST